jgi:hypothetical protein
MMNQTVIVSKQCIDVKKQLTDQVFDGINVLNVNNLL